MRILITGGTGLLGCPLSGHLRTKGYGVAVCGFSNNANHTADLTSRHETFEVLDDIRPDCIINLVALTDVDKCQENPDLAYRLNVKVVENIAHWIHRRSVGTKLIHISSDQVYDGVGESIEEDVVLTNIYAFSKYASECPALSVGGVVLRTNFFGYSQLEGRLSFSDWLIQSFKKQEPIKLVTDVFFNPLSITTLVDCIEKACIDYIPGVYNLGSNQGMSKGEFARKLAKVLSLDDANAKDVSVVDINLRAYRPKDMRMDVAKFENAFKINLPTLESELENIRV